ncbi:MAG: group III truncated hemoglobin [Saprospiraceae bacterium]|nr:group III truncated hemoglobin [Saprospiraceae bacterium]
MKEDIESPKDIELMVHSFYDQIKKDDLLGPIFNGIIQDRWPQHLEKMCRFWQTVLLGQHTYQGSPFRPHAQLPLKAFHFQRWVHLFNHSIDQLFCGQKTEEAKWRANKMAEMFLMKIEYFQSTKVKTII